MPSMSRSPSPRRAAPPGRPGRSRTVMTGPHDAPRLPGSSGVQASAVAEVPAEVLAAIPGQLRVPYRAGPRCAVAGSSPEARCDGMRAVSVKETPITREFWNSELGGRGTLYEEFPAVKLQRGIQQRRH